MGLQAVVTGSWVRYNRDISPTKLSFAYAQTIVRVYANDRSPIRKRKHQKQS